jgi:PhnB protein
MTVSAVPHINLRGQAREALAFWQAAFGGRQTLVTYRDAGNLQHPADADLVMWGEVASDDGFRVMAYDVPSGLSWQPGENAFFVAVGAPTAAEVAARWDRLADGAAVIQPLAPAPWSPLYGMLKDRFGIVWVLNVATPRVPA